MSDEERSSEDRKSESGKGDAQRKVSRELYERNMLRLYGAVCPMCAGPPYCVYCVDTYGRIYDYDVYKRIGGV